MRGPPSIPSPTISSQARCSLSSTPMRRTNPSLCPEPRSNAAPRDDASALFRMDRIGAMPAGKTCTTSSVPGDVGWICAPISRRRSSEAGVSARTWPSCASGASTVKRCPSLARCGRAGRSSGGSSATSRVRPDRAQGHVVRTAAAKPLPLQVASCDHVDLCPGAAGRKGRDVHLAGLAARSSVPRLFARWQPKDQPPAACAQSWKGRTRRLHEGSAGPNAADPAPRLVRA